MTPNKTIARILFVGVALGALLCASLLLAVRVQAQSRHVRTGTLSGVVLSASGRPVPEARVTIQTSDGTHPHATETDAQGRFKFANFAIGSYDIRAYAEGRWSPWQRDLTLRSKRQTKVVVHMPARQK